MSLNPEELLQCLRAAFQVEAAEHLQALSANLLALEKLPAGAAQAELVETIFRSAHSLKGAARAVNESAIELICQQLEDVFAAWKQGAQTPAPEQFDGLHRALDQINGLVNAAAVPAEFVAAPPSTELISTPSPEPSTEPAPTPALAPTPAPTASVAPPTPAPATAPIAPKAPAETIRISAGRLDGLLLQAEELLSAKLTAAQRATELQEEAEALKGWKKAWTKARGQRGAQPRPDAPGADDDDAVLLELLNASDTKLKELQQRLAALAKNAQQDHRTLAGMVDNLLADAKSLMLLPCAPLLDAAHRAARDLARDEGKELELVLQGHDVELDKRILEELKDPLLHLIRNAVDHGLETPAVRTARGKPARGTLTVTVAQLDSGKLELVIADDGGGIDAAKVRAAAVKSGVIGDAAAAQLDDAAAVRLIFESGVSTAAIITEVSGRGLGMAIVREKIERLGGRIEVTTVPGVRTIFRLLLPTSLATFKGILVQAGGQVLVVPSPAVERVLRVRRHEVRSLAGRTTVNVGGAVVPLVRLAEVLGLTWKVGETGDVVTALVLGTGEQRVAFRVTAVTDEQEVLVKPLGFPLVRMRHIAGATVLGSGALAPVLRTADLLASALRLRLSPGVAAAAAVPEKKAVLLAENSITSRMLLKNILEAGGHAVTTAVDGQDAWNQLAAGHFHVVVSDVDMPRVNGFELTAKIRAAAAHAALPVVLVTARGSREDQGRGIDVGANAYIVKSSFDQGNLLEVLATLV